MLKQLLAFVISVFSYRYSSHPLLFLFFFFLLGRPLKKPRATSF